MMDDGLGVLKDGQGLNNLKNRYFFRFYWNLFFAFILMLTKTGLTNLDSKL